MQSLPHSTSRHSQVDAIHPSACAARTMAQCRHILGPRRPEFTQWPGQVIRWPSSPSSTGIVGQVFNYHFLLFMGGWAAGQTGGFAWLPPPAAATLLSFLGPSQRALGETCSYFRPKTRNKRTPTWHCCCGKSSAGPRCPAGLLRCCSWRSRCSPRSDSWRRWTRLVVGSKWETSGFAGSAAGFRIHNSGMSLGET